MTINLCTTLPIAQDTTGRGKYHYNLFHLLQRNGFEVIDSTHRIKGADLYIGTPDRLNGYTEKNAIRIIHSEANEMTNMASGGIIYVAEHLRLKRAYKCLGSFGWWPMVQYEDYHFKRLFRGVIGQINLYGRKGGNTFYEIAEMFPDYKFIGVKGWGRQVIKQLPNVELREYNPDLTSFYKEIDILLLPSASEGLPTVALEAHRFGLPVIGSVIPGNIEAGVICCNDYEATIKQTANHYEAACIEAQTKDKEPDSKLFIDWIKTYL
jgi:hypothetical protein